MTSAWLALPLLALLAAAPPAPPPSAPSPREGWRAHMARRHEAAKVRGSFVMRAVAARPARGYFPVPPTDRDRRRMGPDAAPIYVSKKPILEIRGFRGAHVRWPGTSPDGGGDLFLEWFPEGRKRIHALTTAYLGKKVAMFLNGKFLGAPKVIEPIDTDHVQIQRTSDLPGDEAATLLRALNPKVDTAFVEGFFKRCEEGDAPTCHLLADESLRGRDLPFDPEKAFDFLLQACDGGDVEACAKAADLAHDFPLRGKAGESIRLWEKACGADHLASCQRLGITLSRMAPAVLKNRAETYLGKACDGGRGDACMEVARLLEDRKGKSALKQILARMGQACEHQVVDACLGLGEIALQGKPLDKAPDPVAAKAWFAKACALDPKARSGLLRGNTTAADRERAELMRAAGCVGPPEAKGTK